MSGAAKLHELPAKWRAQAARMFAQLTHSPHANTYEWCADELSAALAETGPIERAFREGYAAALRDTGLGDDAADTAYRDDLEKQWLGSDARAAPAPGATPMTGEAERLADELFRQFQIDQGAFLTLCEENLPLILRHLRAGSPEAVERAAHEMAACEGDRARAAGIPERAIIPWDRMELEFRHARLDEMRRVLRAAVSL